jgi:hypothetical protein
VTARGLAGRIWRAARLEPALYEEIEADRAATAQALAVVLLAALGAGIGSFHNGGLRGMVWIAAAWLLGWYVWARTTCWIGTRLLPAPETRADTGELLRTLGFASSPCLLLVLALYEPLAGTLFLLCGLWTLAAMVVAVRQALDYRGTLRALVVCAIAFPVYAAILAVALLLLGPWPL